MAAPLSPALVFIGFMAAGKSTAALEAAAALGVAAADSDELLERELGTTIPSTSTARARPRSAPPRSGSSAISSTTPTAASSRWAAGRSLSERTRAALRRHTVVLVDVDLETAWARAAGEGRPLARDRDAFARLFAARAALYETQADAVIPGTGDRTSCNGRFPRCARRRTG